MASYKLAFFFTLVLLNRIIPLHICPFLSIIIWWFSHVVVVVPQLWLGRRKTSLDRPRCQVDLFYQENNRWRRFRKCQKLLALETGISLLSKGNFYVYLSWHEICKQKKQSLDILNIFQKYSCCLLHFA